jgi:hypothetical protein
VTTAVTTSNENAADVSTASAPTTEEAALDLLTATATSNQEVLTNSDFLIRFSELLPNPIGVDTEGEFIELANYGTNDAEMNGWLIRDSKGREFNLPIGLIAAGGRLTLPYSETKLPLPNTGGTLELIAPDGKSKETITYSDDFKEGQALAKSADTWYWTDTPTPGFDNVITTKENSTATNSSLDSSATGETPKTQTENNDVQSINATLQVRINELLPAPVGDDALEEWVELYNADVAAASLDGWSLDDAIGGSNPYLFPIGTVIPAKGFLVLSRPTTKLALNNDKDAVRLLAPTGAIVDEINYDGVKEGEALAKFETGWSWTTVLTPGIENVNSAAQTVNSDAGGETIITTADNSDQPLVATETVMPLTVEQAHDLPFGTELTVTGLVTMPLGVVGATIFGLRDLDTNYGATVRIYSSDRPALQVGDIVEVSGTARRKDSGELRIDTSGTNPVTVIGHLDSVAAPVLRLDELDGTGAGLAVTVTGMVADIGNNWFVITDDKAERELKIELPLGSVVPFKNGDQVTVNGIVRVERSVVALAVLDGKDVVENSTETASGNEVENATEITTETEDRQSPGAIPFLVVGALGAGGMAYRGLKIRNNKKKVLI